MLALPPFKMHSPATLEEAVTLLSSFGPDASLVAGGTDILPNMKRGLLAPRHLVSLARVASLRGVRTDKGAIRIGAMTTLDVVASHALVREKAAGLAEAAGAVGGPQHRKMGTLGGNLCLDTRCRYYNQTYFWRQALGFCLKKDGSVCHVVAGGQKCVAAASNDSAPMLIALGATIDLAGPRGLRTLAAGEFYTADGIANTVREPGEIVVAVRVPVREGSASAYEKLRRRGAIDFPILSVAARVDVAGERVSALELVVSALAARPRVVKSAHDFAVGKRPAEVSSEAIGAMARKECNPLPNVDADVAWRKQMVGVLVTRALRRAGLGG
ncbi:MAG TPA: FAD binding domain-containing protein [Polyangiaceae bacterium]|nr:FAD binding domain-containing protein [Polyangiaceae bacterium]